MISRQLLFATTVLFAVVLGLSFYVWRLRQREVSTPRQIAASPSLAPPPAFGPGEKVTIWIAHDDSGTLRPQAASVPFTSGRQQRAEALIRTLLDIYTAKDSPHPLPVGSEVRAIYLVGPDMAIIDLNSVLAKGQVSGILAEELTLTSIIETLSANTPGILRVKILIDGAEGTTLAGHADISTFYNVSQVDMLAKQLESE